VETSIQKAPMCDRFRIAVISPSSIRPTSGEAPVVRETSDLSGRQKSYSSNEGYVITISIGCAGLTAAIYTSR